jgi:hypothetical protein
MERERTLIRSIASALPYYGTGRLCPVCGKQSSRFRTFGIVPRVDAQCAHCDSLERHRLLALYVSRQTDLFDGARKKMLHVASESCFEPMFRKQCVNFAAFSRATGGQYCWFRLLLRRPTRIRQLLIRLNDSNTSARMTMSNASDRSGRLTSSSRADARRIRG